VHEYTACTATNDEIKYANCSERHSSEYKGYKKYRELSNTLKTAATQNLFYRDALKEVKAASHTEKQTSVTTADDHQATPTVEKRSIESQTKNEQAVETEATSVPTSPYTGEEMQKLLQTTAAALIWVIKEMKPTKQQS